MNMQTDDLNNAFGVDTAHPRVVIACRVMKTELDALVSADAPIEIRYLDQNLHRSPERMPALIQAQIEAVSGYAGHIVLGYGLCSNGIVGVSAVRQSVCVPRVHDCVALMLGSRKAYQQAFARRAGTYYLTAGWVAEEKDPLGMMENEYAPKLGRETAEWGIREELRHYTHIVLINTYGGDILPLRKRAKANAEFLDKTYDEISGSSAYFQKILYGPYDGPDFVCIQPGEAFAQKSFIG
ncbi:MAG: DUF1638 domain-containing protein [Thermodesulfobacteriota bacterium]